MQQLTVLLALLVGILLLILAGVYLAEPARLLPHFLPGYALTNKHHITHAFASLVLAVGCFIFAWFRTGKKKTS